LGELDESVKYTMRFYEFKTTHVKQPLSPAQARINALKQNVEREQAKLKAEQARQRQQRANQRVTKAMQQRNTLPT
jgi:multidrug resistance efflux pump